VVRLSAGDRELENQMSLTTLTSLRNIGHYHDHEIESVRNQHDLSIWHSEEEEEEENVAP
jgi:hypothetical protein